MSISVHEQSFDAGPIRINYVEVPASGPPLVLLHGGSARWQSFNVLIPDLVRNWHTYALDLRGHGESARAAGQYRLQDYADDVIAFIQQRVGEAAILVGHSLGGMIALMVADQCSSCVQAVVVGDSPLTAASWRVILDQHRDRIMLWRNLAGGRHSLADIAAAITDAPAINVYKTDPDTITSLLNDFDNVVAGYNDMESLFPSIDCPVLLLQADPVSGGVMTDADVERAKLLLVRPAHVRLAGVSHVLHNEQKEPVLQAMTTFLASL